jgi:hypothetical protein
VDLFVVVLVGPDKQIIIEFVERYGAFPQQYFNLGEKARLNKLEKSLYFSSFMCSST